MIISEIVRVNISRVALWYFLGSLLAEVSNKQLVCNHVLSIFNCYFTCSADTKISNSYRHYHGPSWNRDFYLRWSVHCFYYIHVVHDQVHHFWIFAIHLWVIKLFRYFKNSLCWMLMSAGQANWNQYLKQHWFYIHQILYPTTIRIALNFNIVLKIFQYGGHKLTFLLISYDFVFIHIYRIQVRNFLFIIIYSKWWTSDVICRVKQTENAIRDNTTFPYQRVVAS